MLLWVCLLLSCVLLLQYHPATPTTDKPCLPQGYTWNITAGELFIDPCTIWSNPYSNKMYKKFEFEKGSRDRNKK